MKRDKMPVVVGTRDDNRQNLICGTLNGKMKLDECPYKTSDFDQNKVHIGAESIFVKLLEYPDREQFTDNLVKTIDATTGHTAEYKPSRKRKNEIFKQIQSGDFYSLSAALQFENFTFEIGGVSRTFTHQLVRTRLGAYMQMSGRTCYQGDKFNVRMPFSISAIPKAKRIFEKMVRDSRKAYKQLCAMKLPLEDARFVIPEGIENYIIARYPVNVWLQVYAQRACPLLQWEICWVVRQMKKCVEQVWPEIATLAKVPCENTHKCNPFVEREHRAKFLCDFPWAGSGRPKLFTGKDWKFHNLAKRK
jgi:thymidylate synthase ThyX